MKKVIATLVFMLLTVTIISCGNTNAASKVKEENVLKAKERDNNIGKGAAVVTFDKREYDFGTVNEGDLVETSFVLTNTGKSKLVITNATSTCGCTVPVWPKEPIEPGESAEVKVKFNTHGKPNRQSKTVTLYTNTATGRETVVLKGMVTPKNKNS